jgi:four helix bundle protein
MQDFKQLKMWSKAHSLTVKVHSSTKTFPKDELYSLTSQMRRSASSIPTNIAEGCGRGSDSDMARFIQIAMGSACELEYQLILSKDLNYLIQSDYELLTNDVQEVKRMLASFLKKLRADS